jgi:hypothetical protein
VFDRSVRIGKGPKQIHAGLFADERACAEAVVAKQAEIDASIAAKLHATAQELPHTRGLPLIPANPANAEPHTAYYGEKRMGTKGEAAKVFGPQRYVRAAAKSSPSGFQYVPCCHANLDSGAPCTHVACRVSDSVFCHAHGGAPKAGEGPLSSYCSVCRTIVLDAKRKVRHGGSGMCVTCEAHRKAEAAANGATAPIKADERWEEVVFKKLLPLITYADGTPFPPDQRDERKGGGLGTPKTEKRRRECDTTTNRFPDCLWILRDERARAVLVVIVEVDEHSHTDRDPECETGKIDDTFEALQNKLAKEGAARGAVARHDAEMVPIVTIRMNPNAYDKKRVKLADRVKAVAAVVRAYLHMDAETRDALQTHAPIVHVMYYHSKKGAKHLAHYAAWATQAGWAYTVH